MTLDASSGIVILSNDSNSSSSNSSSSKKNNKRKKSLVSFFSDSSSYVQVGLAILCLLYLVVSVGTIINLPSFQEIRFQQHVDPLLFPKVKTQSDPKEVKSPTKVKIHPKVQMQRKVEKKAPPAAPLDEFQPHVHVRVKQKHIIPPAQKERIQKLQRQFPIHAGEDVEQIVHPAYTESPKVKIFETVGTKYLTVPKFWDPEEYRIPSTARNAVGNVRHYLGEGGKRLMTMEEAQSVGSTTTIVNKDGVEEEERTIFFTIASYRDPECSSTLDSMFERAHKPERIRVAIIEQRLEPGDPKCILPDLPCETNPAQTRCKYKHLFDNFEMDARLGVGPVFARHLGNRYYRGEYFAGQLDSHVRFVEGWDVSIVEQWDQAQNEMAVLTTYLSDLNGSIDPITNKGIRPGRPIMCQTDYEGTGKYKHLRHGQQPEGTAMIHGTPTLHPFWAAGFSFARGHFVVQVPYDQYLPMIFQGEEISIGIRGFTYGYDYYTPEKAVCFHMYAMKAYKARRDKVPHFWENNNQFAKSGTDSMKRLNGLIGMANDPNDTYDHSDEELYGLGLIRQKETFFKKFGIHTETKKVEQHLCSFVGKPMQRMFIPALRNNGMGIDYDKINFEWKDPTNKKK